MGLIGLRFKKRGSAYCDRCDWKIEDGDPGPIKTKSRTHATQNEHSVAVYVYELTRYEKR